MNLLITGGGTGGHLAIAKALKEAAAAKGIRCFYIGSTKGQDRAWFADDTEFVRKVFLHTTGVVDKRGLAKIDALFKVLKSLFFVRNFIKKERIDAVISVGGYSAAPAAFAAKLGKTPLFIHEQNAVSGRLNRMLRPYADAFFCSYDDASPLQDYPVAERFFDTARTRKKIDSVIFLGGSQGARYINDLALKLAKELQKRGLHVIHQCGEKEFARMQEAYAEIGVEVELYGFYDDLSRLLPKADLAISRAGASTLWELCANGLPALFIPYPYAASDHQYHNAKFLLTRNVAWCMREEEAVADTILSLLDVSLHEKSESLRNLSGRGGAEKIINYISERSC